MVQPLETNNFRHIEDASAEGFQSFLDTNESYKQPNHRILDDKVQPVYQLECNDGLRHF